MAPASVVPLGLAGFVLPLITNVILTTLIAMHMVHLPSQGIVIESGMLYVAVQFVFVILFAIGHPAQGIAPTLILVRVALGLSLLNTQSGRETQRSWIIHVAA